MQIFRGFRHASLAPACALTIGNFDGVHRGHQAMLALLKGEALHRGLPATVLTFEPHPRDFFARHRGQPELAPKRIATQRDKFSELQRCGVDQVVVLRFDAGLAALSAEDFVQKVVLDGLGAQFVLVGDDFRFGRGRTGDHDLLDRMATAAGVDVSRMLSYEVHGLRVSSSEVREALRMGQMELASRLLGRAYTISGHVIHGQKLGRDLGCRTLNVAFRHERPATTGIFAVRVRGLLPSPQASLEGVASLGVRPTVEDAGRVLLEVHCFDWPAVLGAEGGYGKIVEVELLHKLRDEARYDGLQALQQAIAKDVADARAFFVAQARQTTRDRI